MPGWVQSSYADFYRLITYYILSPVVTVLTTSNEVFLQEDTWVTQVNIVPPVAKISGGTKLSNGEYDVLNFDAYDSYDPNNSPGGLTYTWSCTNVSRHRLKFK